MNRPLFSRIALVAAEIVVSVFALLIVALCGLYLLMPNRPIESELGQRLAEGALSNLFDGAPVRLEALTIHKGSLKNPFAVRAKGMRIYTPSYDELSDAQPVMTAENAVLDMSLTDLLSGKAGIKLLSVDKLLLRAQRDEQGHMRFELASRDGQSSGASIRPLAVLQKIDALQIRQAQLVLEDLGTGVSQSLADVTVDMRRNETFGQSIMIMTAREKPTDALPVLDFVLTTTDSQEEMESIVYLHDLKLENALPWLPGIGKHIAAAKGLVSGEARAVFNKKTGATLRSKVHLNLPDGTLSLAYGGTRSLPLQDIALNWDDKGGALTGMIDGNAMAITLLPDVKAGYQLKAAIETLPIESVASLWPKDRIDTAAGEWLTVKLGEGQFRNIALSGHLLQDTQTKEWGLESPVATFETENMRVLYKRDLEPVRNLDARGTYENDTLTLKMDSGTVNSLSLVEGELVFTDMSVAGSGHCRGTIRLAGPLQGVLGYLDNPIIRYKERVSVDLSKATGDTQMSVALDFPATKDVKASDIDVKVDAILRNANLPGIVKGVTISGGPLAVKGGADKVAIRGDARLNGVPANLFWQAYFEEEGAPFSQKLELKTQLTRESISDFGMGDWARDVNTPSNASLEFIQPLQGAASASLSVSGPDLSIGSASLNLTPNGGFQSGRFTTLRIGRTQGDLTVDSSKSGMNVTFKGPSFDARPALEDDGGASKEKSTLPANLSVAIDTPQLITGKDGIVRNAIFTMRTNGRGDFSSLALDGVVGAGAAKVRFDETANGDALMVNAADAGAFLRALNLTDGVKGGVLQIEGKPGGAYGSIQGRARIMDFTAQDVPALGRLINALSLPGLFSLLTSEGIFFSRLRSDFTWSAQDRKSVLKLSNGRTGGASLGLTINGTYERPSNRINLAGEIVPLSEVSNFVKKIPILGVLLTGGKDGGILAANYTMRGNAKDPDVSVNPLSVLAPGLLRTILFQNDPDETPVPTRIQVPANNAVPKEAGPAVKSAR